MKKPYHIPLETGLTYHIYNQGNNSENIFKEEKNYRYFLQKYQQYICPICHTYAFCLLPNHFHLMIQFKNPDELYEALPHRFPNPENRLLIENFERKISTALSNQFRFFFGSYSKAINKAYNRSGKLFSLPFKRIIVDTEPYFSHLIAYIHRNPIHHNFTKHYGDWRYSSYKNYLHLNPDFININFVLHWFGRLEDFIEYHKYTKELFLEKKFYLE